MVYLATRYRIICHVLVGLRYNVHNRVAFPEDRVTLTDDLRLGKCIHRRYVDLIHQRTVADRSRTRPVEDSVAEHLTVLCRISAVLLIIYRARRACTYVLAYRARRYGVNIEVQRVELQDMFVSVEHGVGLYSGGVVTLAVLRPYERSVRDTDGLVQPRLFYNVQDTDAVTSGSDRYSLLVVAA